MQKQWPVGPVANKKGQIASPKVYCRLPLHLPSCSCPCLTASTFCLTFPRSAPGEECPKTKRPNRSVAAAVDTANTAHAKIYFTSGFTFTFGSTCTLGTTCTLTTGATFGAVCKFRLNTGGTELYWVRTTTALLRVSHSLQLPPSLRIQLTLRMRQSKENL